MPDPAAAKNSARPNGGRPDGAPLIKIGNRWVPAHTAWAYMETASRFVDSIERFNTRFPDLSSKTSRDVVPLVRERLRNIALRMPEKPDAPVDPGTVLVELLGQLSPEEAIKELQKRTGRHVNLQELIVLAGEDAYIGALTREATEFRNYSIHPEQTAQIWNEMGRTLPCGGLWSTRRVQELLP